jgi:nucleoside-diphosphate-sugar epimerase
LCYGPGQEQNRFLPYLIGPCLKDGEIKISLGEQLRGYHFIDVAVGVVFMSVTNNDVSGKTFNIASGTPVSIEEVVVRVIDIVGSGKPKFGAVPCRKGENMVLFADVNIANKTLSWSAKKILMRV